MYIRTPCITPPVNRSELSNHHLRYKYCLFFAHWEEAAGVSSHQDPPPTPRNYQAPNWVCVTLFLGQQSTVAAEGYSDMRCEYRRRPTHGKICCEAGNNILQVFDQEKSCSYMEQLAAWKGRVCIRLITRRCGIWWFRLIDVDEDSLPAGK